MKYITSDTVRPGQYAKLRRVLPLLECCALDPLHLAIAVEQSTWEYKSELSIALRRVLSKFNPVEPGEAAVGRFYNGSPLEAESSEGNYRADVVFQTNCAAKARRRLRTINFAKGMKSRSEFCMYVYGRPGSILPGPVAEEDKCESRRLGKSLRSMRAIEDRSVSYQREDT